MDEIKRLRAPINIPENSSEIYEDVKARLSRVWKLDPTEEEIKASEYSDWLWVGFGLNPQEVCELSDALKDGRLNAKFPITTPLGMAAERLHHLARLARRE